MQTEHGERVVRAALLICSVDLPARSMCANMKQFNGKCGCIYCVRIPAHPGCTHQWYATGYLDLEN